MKCQQGLELSPFPLAVPLGSARLLAHHGVPLLAAFYSREEQSGHGGAPQATGGDIGVASACPAALSPGLPSPLLLGG